MSEWPGRRSGMEEQESQRLAMSYSCQNIHHMTGKDSCIITK